MQPSTRLSQGKFEDTDLILADNFARACEAQNIKQILYVGGILPKEKNISAHLRSRHEVELTLGSRKTPLTAIRAGLIIGPGGSSFKIIEKLVSRLPIMACPQWTLSKTQSVALKDMLTILDYCIGKPEAFNEAIEVGGHRVMSYKEMLTLTAKVMGKKRLVVPLPFFSVGLSKLWVSIFSDSSIPFISPLVESLRHSMIADSHPIIKKMDIDFISFEEAVKFAIDNKHLIPKLPRRLPVAGSEEKEKNTVRSVQRLSNPRRDSATWVARRYTHWLPGFFRSFIRVRTDEHENCSFHIMNFSEPILQLTFIKERSKDDRQLFYITGGLLDKRSDYGWLEFREVLD